MKNSKNGNVWVISDRKFINLDISEICSNPDPEPVSAYSISELAKYLLNPDPITLQEKVIGCKILYRKPAAGVLKRIYNKITGSKNSADQYTEEIISSSKVQQPEFEDNAFNSYLTKILEQIKPYDLFNKKISGIDREMVEDVIATCEDIGGNRYSLNLQGGTADKLSFVSNSVSRKTSIVMNRAYLLNGLFEMRGFTFNSFNPDNSYLLANFSDKGQTRSCVLNANDYTFEYWIDDPSIINYMHILQQSIKTDLKLREALQMCAIGKAIPLKLFFSRQLEHKYTEDYLPGIFRDAFSKISINPGDKNTITQILNNSQNIVSFNYVPVSEKEKRRMFTNISVMHELKALEPIKSRLPELYMKIKKKAPVSDDGKLYLLDSMRGYQDV